MNFSYFPQDFSSVDYLYSRADSHNTQFVLNIKNTFMTYHIKSRFLAELLFHLRSIQ